MHSFPALVALLFLATLLSCFAGISAVAAAEPDVCLSTTSKNESTGHDRLKQRPFSITTSGTTYQQCNISNQESCNVMNDHNPTWILFDYNHPLAYSLKKGHHPIQRFSSPKDLCQETKQAQKNSIDVVNNVLANDFALHCFTMHSNSTVSAIGVTRKITFESVMERVNWFWALGLTVLLLFLWSFNCGATQKSQYWNVALYLCAVVLYKSLRQLQQERQSTTAIWLAGDLLQDVVSFLSLMTSIVESCYIFVLVHPITSTGLVVSHVATSWFQLAAWRSKTLQQMIAWYILYEFVAGIVNEWAHAMDTHDGVRCARLFFIQNIQSYAINDTIRDHVLAPLLVYGYLLPTFIFHWFSVWVTTMWEIVMVILGKN